MTYRSVCGLLAVMILGVSHAQDKLGYEPPSIPIPDPLGVRMATVQYFLLDYSRGDKQLIGLSTEIFDCRKAHTELTASRSRLFHGKAELWTELETTDLDRQPPHYEGKYIQPLRDNIAEYEKMLAEAQSNWSKVRSGCRKATEEAYRRMVDLGDTFVRDFEDYHDRLLAEKRRKDS